MTPTLRLARRIAMALGIGRQLADTNEAAGTATMQVALAGGELRSDLPHMQLFGFCSRPMPGGDAIVIFQAGDRGRGVVIASNDQRYRPQTLAPGEACLWHPSGSTVLMRADGAIELTPSSGQAFLDGTLHVSKDVLIGTTSLGSHTHGGVQAGTAQTLAPTQGS